MPPHDFVDKIDLTFLQLLIGLMKTAQFTVTEAKEKSRQFTQLMPFLSFNEMRNKLKEFTQQNKEFGHLYITYLQMEDKERKTLLLDRLQKQFST